MFDITLLWIRTRQHPGKPRQCRPPLWNQRLPRVLSLVQSGPPHDSDRSSAPSHGIGTHKTTSPTRRHTRMSVSIGPQRSARGRSPTCSDSPPPQHAAAPYAGPPICTSWSGPVSFTPTTTTSLSAPGSRPSTRSRCGCYHPISVANTLHAESVGLNDKKEYSWQRQRVSAECSSRRRTRAN
jgi:hypothetical protein